MNAGELTYLVSKLRQTLDLVAAGSLLGNLGGSVGGVQAYDRASVLAWLDIGSISGVGTVSSVGLSMPGIFSVSGSPVSTTGTLTASLVSQSANQVFAGPTSGGSAAPGFRNLVEADIPALTSSKISDFTTAARAAFTAGTGIGIAAGVISLGAHVHSAADMTSGTLGLARGGTGGTDAATARTSLDVPTRAGGNASGTWPISITGDAGTLDGLDWGNQANTSAVLRHSGFWAGLGGVRWDGSAWVYTADSTRWGFFLRHGDASGVSAGAGGRLQIGFAQTVSAGAASSAGSILFFAFDKNGQLVIPAATGVAPLSVSSTTVVTNLNADTVDGQHASAFAAAVHSHPIADVSGLQTALDGKAALSHSHPWADITGTPTTRAGYGITDAADLAAFNAHVALATAHGISAFGATLVSAASNTAARTTLGLGTAATRNVPASGDAAGAEVVLGADTRLSNARTPTAHGHPVADLSDAAAWARAWLQSSTDAGGGRGGLGLNDSSTELAAIAQWRVRKAGGTALVRRGINFVDGAGGSVSIADNPGADRVDVTVGLAAHTHDAGDLVTGTIAAARLSGPYTGITSLGTLDALTVSGSVSLQSAALPGSSNYWLCFGGDPTSTAQVVRWRTAAQVLVDIGGVGPVHAHAATDITSGTLNSARLSGSYSGVTGLGTLTALTVSGAVTLSGLGADLTSGSGYLPVMRSSGGGVRAITQSAFVSWLNLQIGDVTGLQSTLDLKAWNATRIDGILSVLGGGTLTGDRTLSLVNDVASPGGSRYYGTDQLGVKGWHAFALSGSGSADRFAVWSGSGTLGGGELERRSGFVAVRAGTGFGIDDDSLYVGGVKMPRPPTTTSLYGLRANGATGAAWELITVGGTGTVENVGANSTTIYGKKTIRFVSNDGSITIAVQASGLDEVEVNLQVT